MITTYKYNLMKTSTPSLTFQSNKAQDIVDVLETFVCPACLEDAYAVFETTPAGDESVFERYIAIILEETRCGQEYIYGVTEGVDYGY